MEVEGVFYRDVLCLLGEEAYLNATQEPEPHLPSLRGVAA